MPSLWEDLANPWKRKAMLEAVNHTLSIPNYKTFWLF
jgi:hypothetical protein